MTEKSLLRRGWVMLLLMGQPFTWAQAVEEVLQCAIAAEPENAPQLSAVYDGTAADFESGGEFHFRFIVQGGDQCLYVLDESDTPRRLGYSRNKAWQQTDGSDEVKAVEAATQIASWKLLALLLSPNRFSALVTAAQSVELAGQDAQTHRVYFDLGEGLEFTAHIDRATCRLSKVVRQSSGQERVMAFDDYREVEGIPTFSSLKLLREGLPYRLYSIEKAGYGARLPDELFEPRAQMP